ncbi:MAG: ThiF family adenylyltransferase [Oscillospiraceae bacterium]
MSDRFVRTRMLLGSDAMEKLKKSKVAVFGLGGVGGSAAEALARSGVGKLELIDRDTVALSNLNRQIIATEKTLGMPKVEAAKARILEIDPEIEVTTRFVFYTTETVDEFDLGGYDYIIDAIDTVTGKLHLVQRAMAAGTPIISAMGAGNKLDPTAFVVTDISKTLDCPLARIMRKELGKRGIKHLKVVYSREKAMAPHYDECDEALEHRRQIPGSVAFVPPVAGFILAGEVIKDLTGVRNEQN